MENIMSKVEQVPQIPQEDFIPVTPTVEASPVIQEEVKQETQPTTSKATLIKQPENTESGVTKTETSSQSYGYARPEGQQLGSGNLNGNFMSSLVFDKSNRIPVTQ